ncbi:hypothetical protein TRFO_36279 [Tritrichomonas foetus]|uniref:C2HC/C3H-type domain-containing protein n=1 Tax=Tritrichomonas foetus TaxID=1144522 RepID=A0A1J4JEI5_9EUKA|nr:hypothetical protein TRFO_36279 [Tritrichomonas foetus]|eukprot:OHS97520.1 hypothetical protein TRFO_36279 [Tritrichomonas foetus]
MMLKKMQADKGGGGNSQNQQNQQKQQNYQKKQQNTPPEEDYPSGRSSGRLISQDVIDEAPKMAKKTPQQQQRQNQIQKQQQQQQQRRQPSRNAYEDDDENEDDSDDGYKPPPPPPKRPAQRKPMSSAPPPPADEDDGDDDRVECAYCHRKFASDRVAKHEEVCARMSTKKKRVFDAQKMRLKGTEAAQYATKAQKQPESKKPSKFKQEHQKLVEALRAARKIQAYEKAKEEGKAVGPPPELPKYEIEDDDRTPCPYCGRKFGGDAAQKHIAVCERMNGNKGRMNMGGANRRGGRR